MHPAAVAGMGHRRAIARVSVSALVASLPLLYVSLLRLPPAALAGDTAFWFLMSNCIVAAIVATSDDDPCASAGQQPLAVQGTISDHALPSSIEGDGEDAATECSAEPTVKNNREVVPIATTAISEPRPKQEGDSPPPVAPAAQYTTREADLRRSETVGSNSKEYWLLSDEELNRRVEDFIARFNREMRLQVEQEARL
ncbi:unnamed protein product [Urochloa humidicola]